MKDKNQYIGVHWVDKKTEETIFIDAMAVRTFKRAHKVSPHYCRDCGGYHDVIIKISSPTGA